MMVSVIIAVRNGELTLEKALLSVFDQDYDEKEVIIIDGASTDGTISIIDKYRDKICYSVSEPDKGIYDAMNKGIKASHGDWIYFLGCDDMLYDKFVLSRLFGNDLHGIDVVYGNVRFLQSGEIYGSEYNYDKLCITSPCHQAVFYRRYLFDKFGYFDIKYRTASDYMLHVKTFCGGAVWKYFDHIVAVYNETGTSSKSYTDKLYHNQLFKYCYDNFRGKISDMTLSRIFYSTFPKFFWSHKIHQSRRYLRLVISDVGFFRLLGNFFVLLYKYRIRNAKD